MAEIVLAVVKNHIDTAAQLAIDNITPLDGEITFESDTGLSKTGDGVTAYNGLPYDQMGFPETFDIAASDTVKAIPPITGRVQRFRYYWKNGDGSNTFSMTVSDGSTVGGLPSGDWVGDGDGFIDLESDGVSDWKVIDYRDFIIELTDTIHTRKFTDGTMEKRIFNKSVGNTGITFDVSFINTSYNLSGSSDTGAVVTIFNWDSKTISGFTARSARFDTGANTNKTTDILMVGRWRI